jgi:hypothetical protein
LREFQNQARGDGLEMVNTPILKLRLPFFWSTDAKFGIPESLMFTNRDKMPLHHLPTSGICALFATMRG